MPALDPSGPKTTRPAAASRRAPRKSESTKKKGRTFDAFPDRIDVRDWVYQPHLRPLPDQVVNCDRVPRILDQGSQGACTGYALAAVINYLLYRRDVKRPVSPRMLYEMARLYDEWPRENYSGSSARGAMVGFIRHGVCEEELWPADVMGKRHFSPELSLDAMRTPGGAFYRVMHRQVRDVHAALAEIGILYITLMVHDGWDEPKANMILKYEDDAGKARSRKMPVITRLRRAEDGHAVAIVGYTADGFIIQNSWGTSWGGRGFALLPYEDYLLHATDVWAVQLGVPVTVDLWEKGASADSTAGRQRATDAIPLNVIRPYVVDIGNNGELSQSGNYWTTEDDLDRLFNEHIPKAAADGNWTKNRLMLYLHGGLNDEASVARRIVSFRDVCLENGIYPLHIMWETGAFETLKSILADLFTDADTRAGGVADWLRKMREGLIEAKDRTFEVTTAKAGRALWSEMKENARRASDRQEKGGMPLLINAARKALENVSAASRKKWELHVVAHSAGSIFAAYALDHLASLAPLGVEFKTLQLLAPAATVDLFRKEVLPRVNANTCPAPVSYILSDTGELDDDVGPYGKSLLYLVSNAFEDNRGMQLLGMEKFVRRTKTMSIADADIAKYFEGKTDEGLPRLVVAGEVPKENKDGRISRSESHVGFDNDTDTLNSVLFRILGKAPKRPFEVRDLQY